MRGVTKEYVRIIGLQLYVNFSFQLTIEKTYSHFYGIFVTDETDFRGPCIAGNDSGDEYVAFVVSGIRCGYVCAIR